MKTIQTSAIVLLMLSSTSVFAQKYKVKDGVIFKNKKENVGKAIGDIGYNKADLLIYGLNNEKVMSVTMGNFDVKNPFVKSLSWQKIKFEDTDKELTLYHSGNCGIKCFINKWLVPKGIILNGGVIENQEAIIAEHDVSKKVVIDTVEWKAQHEGMLDLLTNNEIIRDYEKPIKLVKVNQEVLGGMTTTTYNIAQDNTFIGKIVKTHVQSSTKVTTDYAVYERLYEPTASGKEDVPACKVVSTFMDFEFKTVVDQKRHKMKVTDSAKAERALAIYMVKNGYL
jgi:hypothetical protein